MNRATLQDTVDLFTTRDKMRETEPSVTVYDDDGVSVYYTSFALNPEEMVRITVDDLERLYLYPARKSVMRHIKKRNVVVDMGKPYTMVQAEGHWTRVSIYFPIRETPK